MRRLTYISKAPWTVIRDITKLRGRSLVIIILVPPRGDTYFSEPLQQKGDLGRLGLLLGMGYRNIQTEYRLEANPLQTFCCELK